jgi:hypothetical protein
VSGERDDAVGLEVRGASGQLHIQCLYSHPCCQRHISALPRNVMLLCGGTVNERSGMIISPRPPSIALCSHLVCTTDHRRSSRRPVEGHHKALPSWHLTADRGMPVATRGGTANVGLLQKYRLSATTYSASRIYRTAMSQSPSHALTAKPLLPAMHLQHTGTASGEPALHRSGRPAQPRRA